MGWKPAVAPDGCGAEEFACRCVLKEGHEGPHECDPDRCGGAWTGSMTTNDFEAVRLPGGGVDPLLSLLLGLDP